MKFMNIAFDLRKMKKGSSHIRSSQMGEQKEECWVQFHVKTC